jgi:hypothetical protein
VRGTGSRISVRRLTSAQPTRCSEAARAYIILSGRGLLVDISRRLRHWSITVTADVYSHVSPVTIQVSVQRLAEKVDHG